MEAQHPIKALATWINAQTEHFSPNQAYAGVKSSGITSADVLHMLHEWHSEGRLKFSKVKMGDDQHYYLRTDKWDL